MYIYTYMYIYAYTFFCRHVYICMYVCLYVYISANICCSLEPLSRDVYYHLVLVYTCVNI